MVRDLRPYFDVRTPKVPFFALVSLRAFVMSSKLRHPELLRQSLAVDEAAQVCITLGPAGLRPAARTAGPIARLERF